MHRGYVKVFRKKEDSYIMTDPYVNQVFDLLLIKATHKLISTDFNGQKVVLQPGQYISGNKKIAESLNISVEQVKRAIKKLIRGGTIVKKSSKKGSIFSIVNWDIYQNNLGLDNTDGNQQATNWQPTTNQQATTKQECKHVNSNFNKDTCQSCPARNSHENVSLQFGNDRGAQVFRNVFQKLAEGDGNE